MELKKTMSKSDMRNLLSLCTRNIHFCFDGDSYQQNDGIALAFPLGLLLIDIIMEELVTRITKTVTDGISKKRIYEKQLFRVYFSAFELDSCFAILVLKLEQVII